MMFRKALLCLLILCLCGFCALPCNLFATDYSISQSNTSVGFSIQYLKFWDVRGCFYELNGELELDQVEKKLNSIYANIRVYSLDTGIEFRDNQLMTELYFYEERYPVIHFESQKINFTSSNQFEIQGIISIKGVSNPIQLKGSTSRKLLDNDTGEITTYLAEGIIDRKQFKIGPMEFFYPDGLLISKNVAFRINSEICWNSRGNEIVCPEKQPQLSEKEKCKNLNN